jgi:hydroxyquinol 1,2-dioxygenase
MTEPRHVTDVESLTAAVIDSFQKTPDPRLRHILTVLTRHLHRAVEEIRLTRDEWDHGIKFLTAVGQLCDDTRQEFVLLSDVLGVSMLIEVMHDDVGSSATESTVLGPFHMTASPPRALGDNIDLVGNGTPCLVTGRVVGAGGTPLAAATLDVWQADASGFYDVQCPDSQPSGNGRGLFTTDNLGRFWFRTVLPSDYPIPVDGPVGNLLRHSHRHPYRPAHIHFIASAAGHEPVTTHIFVAGSDYLSSDAVFAVRPTLVVDFVEQRDEQLGSRYSMSIPFLQAHVELALRPKGGQRSPGASNASETNSLQ